MSCFDKSAKRMSDTIYPLLLTILCILLGVSMGRGDVKHTHKVTMAQAYGDFSWTREAWTGNDKPFQLARDAIDAELAAGMDASALTQRLKTKAAQKPEDALAQFRWGYAAWSYARSPTLKQEEEFAALQEPLLAITSVPSPHTYNYARLRFLILTFGIPPIQLKDIGERLLKANPQDIVVGSYLATLLIYSDDVRDRQQAITYTQQLVQQYPKDAKYYGLLAGIAYTTWFRSKSQADADKAIAAYQHYLDLAAPNEVFRDNAQFYIKYIQKMQDHWNRGDKLPQ